jgi:predicted DNA-binding protein
MTDIDQTENEPVGKYQRSVSLDQQMAARLHKVCEHLGVTVSAYLKQVIGEAVSRHEVTLLPKQQVESAEAMLLKFFETAAQELQADKGGQDEKPRRQRKTTSK